MRYLHIASLELVLSGPHNCNTSTIKLQYSKLSVCADHFRIV